MRKNQATTGWVRRRSPGPLAPNRATHTRVQELPPSSTMQTPAPAAAADAPSDRYVVRLSGALAALLGDVELPEDELLGWLREQGLITYPSPLLGALLEELLEVLAAEVLPLLDPADLAVFARVGGASRAVVVASGLPRAGTGVGVPLKVPEFCGSVERLAWAKDNGCPWIARTCQVIARHGNLQVLRRARELDCSWDVSTCAAAAEGGHLEVLQWAREYGYAWWTDVTCARAAAGGHLALLQWLREHHCPWDDNLKNEDVDCCAQAAWGGHLEVLKWLRQEGCPWDASTCTSPLRAGDWRC